MQLPRITVVTPSFNQGAYIEQTIRSVLDQDYPNLEYMIIDGGSSDETVEICQRYESALAYWVSERDRGQSHAINKGFGRATGDILYWLCSDDYLMPGALRTVADYFTTDPSIDVLAGSCQFRYLKEPERDALALCAPEDLKLFPYRNPVWQPSCFFRRKLLCDRAEAVREDYHFTMDHELWSYFNSIGAKWKAVPDVLSTYVVTGDNKSFTGGLKALAEFERVYHSYTRDRIPLTLWFRGVYLSVARWQVAQRRAIVNRAGRRLLREYERILEFCYGRDQVRGFRSYYIGYGVEQAAQCSTVGAAP